MIQRKKITKTQERQINLKQLDPGQVGRGMRNSTTLCITSYAG